VDETLPVSRLNTVTRELDLGSAKAYHLPNWHNLTHPERLGIIRQIASMRGRDPRVAKLAVAIVKLAGASPRDYDSQAAALLEWVQDPQNVYYVNEPGERLQDPVYTVQAGHGDCDDQVLLLCSFFESLGLSWRLCLSGRGPNGERVRHVEGSQMPTGCTWAHVYCAVGTPPFHPTRWYFCECTVQGVPLGWDVVEGDRGYLPAALRHPDPRKGVIPAPPPPPGLRLAPIPPVGHRSPAYGQPWGQVGVGVGASLAEELDDSKTDWAKVGMAIATGVAVSVGTQLLLDWIGGKGLWKNKGAIHTRAAKAQAKARKTLRTSVLLPSFGA